MRSEIRVSPRVKVAGGRFRSASRVRFPRKPIARTAIPGPGRETHMIALASHLDDLSAVLRASARLGPSAGSPGQLRADLAKVLRATDPAVAERVRGLDDWHAEALADFLAEAHVLARALDRPAPGAAADDTKVD
jgi:hypothetical protein